jgi:hypothetical protein
MPTFEERRKGAMDVLGAVLLAVFVGAPLVIYFWRMTP